MVLACLTACQPKPITDGPKTQNQVVIPII